VGRAPCSRRMGRTVNGECGKVWPQYASVRRQAQAESADNRPSLGAWPRSPGRPGTGGRQRRADPRARGSEGKRPGWPWISPTDWYGLQPGLDLDIRANPGERGPGGEGHLLRRHHGPTPSGGPGPGVQRRVRSGGGLRGDRVRLRPGRGPPGPPADPGPICRCAHPPHHNGPFPRPARTAGTSLRRPPCASDPRYRGHRVGGGPGNPGGGEDGRRPRLRRRPAGGAPEHGAAPPGHEERSGVQLYARTRPDRSHSAQSVRPCAWAASAAAAQS
jgi:hypothetical protein